MNAATEAGPGQAGTAWAPLRLAAFRALWLGQLGIFPGTVMQTVGAQWLLIDEPNAPTLRSLVQTASLMPRMPLALPAGGGAGIVAPRSRVVGVKRGTPVGSVEFTAMA